jgi:hypothetical protein
VPERAIIAILPAVTLGFIAGMIAAALQLDSTPTLIVGFAGAAVVLLIAASSVLGTGGAAGEMTIVAVLRALCAAALYGCMFLFINGFLREGQVSSLVWIVIGIALGLVLTQLRVRDRGDVEAQPNS